VTLAILAVGPMKDKGRQDGTVLGAWARRRWWLLAAVLGLLVVLGVGVVFSLALMLQTNDLLNQPDQAHADLTRSALQYQTDNLTKLWTGIVQVIVAVVLAIGGCFTWRNLRVAEENVRVTQERLDVDRQALITNRFTQAIGQLGAELKDGKPNLEVRLGGIYALERIARDSARDHWTIMEILTAYVRQNALWIEPPEDGSRKQPHSPEELTSLRTDIQAILTVIGRRIRSDDRPEPAGLDLHGTDLRPVDLTDAHLERADLWGAHLEGASLVQAHLEGARLRQAHLEEAALVGAYLQGADLRDAHLERAYLSRSELRTTPPLTADQLKSAATWKGARVPPELAYLDYNDEKPVDASPVPPTASPPPTTS
jgi:hypothetical protein